MKRDARLKAVFFPRKDCFQSSISLHFLAFVVCYGFSNVKNECKIAPNFDTFSENLDFINLVFFKGQNGNKGGRFFSAKEEKFCNDTNGDTYPEGGRYWVNCNHGYCQCTARSQEPYSSKNSQKYCHLNQHSFATCARGTYINMSSVVEFQKWWVLKSKIFGQESTYLKGKKSKQFVDEWQFIKNWAWF